MMKEIQNVYDNEKFFNDYQTMRAGGINANELIEIPIMKTLLPDLNGKSILDVGCGAGGMSAYFAEHGAKTVLGIDISENMLAEAVKNNKHQNVSFQRLSMEDISKINQKFDIVFSSLAVHYVEDFDKLMKDVSNLLNPNGMLIFSQEHPIATAIIRENNIPKYIVENDKRYYLVSDYNVIGERKLDWNIEGVIKYHRNFSTIINAIANAGLSIVQMEDSYASPKAIELVEKYKYQKDRPFFAFFKAIKL